MGALSRLSDDGRESLISWLVDVFLSGEVERFVFEDLHTRFGVSSREFDALVNSEDFREALWDRLEARRIFPAFIRAKLAQCERAAGGHLDSAKQMFTREYEGVGQLKLTQSIEGDMSALRDFVRREALGG